MTPSHDTRHVDPHVVHAQKLRSRTQETRGAEEAKSKEGMERSRGRPRKEKNEMRRSGVRTRTMMWGLIEGGVFFTTALATDTHKGWCLLSYLNIGEAANPGPEYRRGISVWSANVTSLSKRWQSMATWEPDVMVIQETRLGGEAQRIMGMRITQDGRVPLFGNPMPLKQKKDKEGHHRGETIWDAQQGGWQQ